MSRGLTRRWRILNRDNFTCQYCGQSAPDVRLEVDHIEPRWLGGSNNDGNLIVACWDCNRGKAGNDSLDALVGKDWITSLRKDVTILMVELDNAKEEIKYLRHQLVALQSDYHSDLTHISEIRSPDVRSN